MKYLMIGAALFSGASLAVDNHTTLCVFGGNERKIEIVYPEGTELPCEVQYTKNGEMSVLWNAKGEIGYCEAKAAEFVEKQQGWGWECNNVSAVPEAEEIPESNDSSLSEESSQEIIN